MDYRFRTVFVTTTLFPRFQTDESHTGVLCLAAEAKAVNRKDTFYVRFLVLQIVIRHLIQHFLRSLLRRASG